MGEPMPDKNDPKYKERYEREKEYGRRFGQAIGLGWLGAKIRLVATKHQKAFYIGCLAVMIFLTILSVGRLFKVLFYHHPSSRPVVIERVDSAMRPRLDKEHERRLIPVDKHNNTERYDKEY